MEHIRVARLWRRLAAGLCLLVGGAVMAFAQLNRGIVEGTVTDPAGAAIVNASVTVTSLDTGTSNPTKTNDTGYYRAVDLVPGRYRVHIESTGFAPLDVVDVQVPAGQVVKVNGQMKMGSTQQTVQVVAAEPLLQTAPTNASSTVESQIIQDVPLQGRDLQQLVYLLPGVQNVAGPPGSNFGFNSQFGSFPDPTYVQGSDVSVNGGQGGANAWYLDGSLNVSTLSENIAVNPAPDAVSEFQAVTSNLSAQYGRTGGGAFNVVLKSGTNQLHGSLYGYLRNSALDARNPFTSVDAEGNLIPSRRLQYEGVGGTIGGPVVLPHIYNGRDKTFFFFSLDKTFLDLTGTQTFTVPTPLMRQGNFSEDPASVQFGIWNPWSTTGPGSNGLFQRTALGTAAPGYTNGCLNSVVEAAAAQGKTSCIFSTQIPASMQNSTAMYFINSYPMPNFNNPNSNCPLAAGGAYKICGNFLGTVGSSQNPINTSVKVDHQWSPKNKFFVEWLFNPGTDNVFRTAWTGPTFPSSGFGSSFPVDFANQVAGVGNTYVFNPTLINEFRASFSRQYMNSHPSGNTFPESVSHLSQVQQVLAPSQIYLGPGVPDPQWFVGMPVGNSSTFGNAGFLNMMRAGEAYTILDNVTKIMGHHTLMTGFLYRDEHDGRLIYDPTQLNFASPGNANLVTDPVTGLGGFGLEQFMLGAPSPNATQTGLTGQPYQTDHYWGFFIQDDFRVKPNFTLNLGLRYDIPGYWRTRQQPMSNFCLGCMDPNSGLQGMMVYSGSPQLPAGSNIYPANKKDFAPRVNFSWSPGGNPKTVVRGGYDMYYTNATNALNNNGQGVAPGPLWQLFAYWSGSYNPSQCSPFLMQCPPWELGNPTVPTGQLTVPPIPSNNLSPAQEKSPGYGAALQFYAPPPPVDPMIQMWNLSIQRELPGNMMVEIGYVGSHGSHLAGDTFRSFNYVPTADKLKYQNQLNTEVPISQYFSGKALTLMEQTWGATQLPLSSMLVPYPLFGNIFSQTVLDASSSYNAMHIKVQKRFSHGLDFIAVYTWSKEIDSCSLAQLASQLFDPVHSGYNGNIGGRIGAQGGGFASGSSGVFGTGCQNEDDRAADRTISIQDIPQAFNIAGTYQLPFGPGRAFLNHGGVAGALLGGWVVTGNFNAESGTPLNVTGPCSGVNGTSPLCRPDLVGDPSLSHSRPKADQINDWINANAFLPSYGSDQSFWQNPTPNSPLWWQFGTAGLYLPGLRGPGFWNFDTSLTKQFHFSESRYFQFRWELFNAFNHQNLGLPNTNFCLPPLPDGTTDAVHQAGCSFGKITNIQTDPRSMQFSLKFVF